MMMVVGFMCVLSQHEAVITLPSSPHKWRDKSVEETNTVMWLKPSYVYCVKKMTVLMVS